MQTKVLVLNSSQLTSLDFTLYCHEMTWGVISVFFFHILLFNYVFVRFQERKFTFRIRLSVNYNNLCCNTAAAKFLAFKHIDYRVKSVQGRNQCCFEVLTR